MAFVVRVYRVDDGGLDQEGNQIYQRTLKLERSFDLPRNFTDAQIVAVARVKLTAWALELGFNLPEDRLICTL
jgi:hypothetical protein